MLEQKLIVGRYIELGIWPPVLAGAAVNGFQRVTSVVRHLEESASVGAPNAPLNIPAGASLRQKFDIRAAQARGMVQNQFNRQRVSGAGVGASAKMHRNFVWLEWLGGWVSEVQPGGVDVLTGPMSGCWITSYLRNGVRCVGHVGTVMNAADPQSVAARTAWNNFAQGLQMGAMSGFNPFNDWNGAFPAHQAGDGAAKMFALVTSGGAFYAVATFSQAQRANRLRIAGIQQIQPTLRNDGQI